MEEVQELSGTGMDELLRNQCFACRHSENLINIHENDDTCKQSMENLLYLIPEFKELNLELDCNFCTHCLKVLASIIKFKDNCLRSYKEQLDAVLAKNNVDPTRTKTVPNFNCYHCGCDFTRKYMLEKHMQIHNSAPEEEKTKRYDCARCQSIFTTKKKLEIHKIECLKDEMMEYNDDEEDVDDSGLLKSESCFDDVESDLIKSWDDNRLRSDLNVDVKNSEFIFKNDDSDISVDTNKKQSLENRPSDMVLLIISDSADVDAVGDVKSEDLVVKEEENVEVIIKPKAKRGRKPLAKTVNKCEECKIIFTTKYLLNRHTRNVHATEKNHNCDICGQKFASPVYLAAHKKYHSGDRTHICSFCGKGYITASDLYHHEKIHANKRAYKCDKCPKAFNTSSDLHKHHICVHKDRSEWKYVCAYCNRRFPLKTNLDTHTKTHTGERNYACHLCERRCINRSVLMRHIESHSNVRTFKCAHCGQDYKYQKSLDIHLTRTHGIGDTKIPDRVKRHFCHICPKSYFANNKLQKHIRSHTGERPFACELCDKKFIDKSYVRQHLKTAHNVAVSKGFD